jgi:hypothetical protein
MSTRTSRLWAHTPAQKCANTSYRQPNWFLSAKMSAIGLIAINQSCKERRFAMIWKPTDWSLWYNRENDPLVVAPIYVDWFHPTHPFSIGKKLSREDWFPSISNIFQLSLGRDPFPSIYNSALVHLSSF